MPSILALTDLPLLDAYTEELKELLHLLTAIGPLFSAPSCPDPNIKEKSPNAATSPTSGRRRNSGRAVLRTDCTLLRRRASNALSQSCRAPCGDGCRPHFVRRPSTYHMYARSSSSSCSRQRIMQHCAAFISPSLDAHRDRRRHPHFFCHDAVVWVYIRRHTCRKLRRPRRAVPRRRRRYFRNAAFFVTVRIGGTENAGPENAGPENEGPSRNAASLCN